MFLKINQEREVIDVLVRPFVVTGLGVAELVLEVSLFKPVAGEAVTVDDQLLRSVFGIDRFPSRFAVRYFQLVIIEAPRKLA